MLLLVGCSGSSVVKRQHDGKQQNDETQQTTAENASDESQGEDADLKDGTASGASRAPKFKKVSVPVALNSPQDRADYVAKRYWTHFNFSDTTLISRPEITEQALADYIDVLHQVSPATARESISALMRGAEADKAMFEYFCSLTERYLYDPNSPLRDEELFIPVLEYIVASPNVESIMKVRPQELLTMALKNRPGFRATDFGYVAIDGRVGRMSTILSDYTLLFFNNPGCHACGEIMQQINESKVLDMMLTRGQLTILALYPDNDMKEWRKYATQIPSRWINAYDRSQRISEMELYDLKAIPTLYLLDSDKNVLLKDATFDAVERYLGPKASPR